MSIADTASFRLGVIGTVVAHRFAERIEHLQLKPKHIGLLMHLESHRSATQLEVARAMGVVPSLLVRLTDHLEDLGAIERTIDPVDRRRQPLRLTAKGRRLLRAAAAESQSLESEIFAGMADAERLALTSTLEQISGNLGMPLEPVIQ